MAQKLFFTVLVLASCLAGAFARLCYLCNSYTDGDHRACLDPMSPYPAVGVKNCADDQYCTRASFISHKQLVVARGCYSRVGTCDKARGELKAMFPDMAVFDCYLCTGNFCNSGPGPKHLEEEVEPVEASEVLEAAQK